MRFRTVPRDLLQSEASIWTTRRFQGQRTQGGGPHKTQRSSNSLYPQLPPFLGHPAASVGGRGGGRLTPRWRALTRCLIVGPSKWWERLVKCFSGHQGEGGGILWKSGGIAWLGGGAYRPFEGPINHTLAASDAASRGHRPCLKRWFIQRK